MSGGFYKEEEIGGRCLQEIFGFIEKGFCFVDFRFFWCDKHAGITDQVKKLFIISFFFHLIIYKISLQLDLCYLMAGILR